MPLCLLYFEVDKIRQHDHNTSEMIKFLFVSYSVLILVLEKFRSFSKFLFAILYVRICNKKIILERFNTYSKIPDVNVCAVYIKYITYY